MAVSVLGAQQTGEISGKITDERGEALPGVSVTAKSPSLQGLRTALSDRNGNFRLPALSVGTYALTFELAGFEKVTVTDQDVRLGFTVSLSPVLKPSGVSEEVTVVAPQPLIDKTTADNSYRLNSESWPGSRHSPGPSPDTISISNVQPLYGTTLDDIRFPNVVPPAGQDSAPEPGTLALLGLGLAGLGLSRRRKAN